MALWICFVIVSSLATNFTNVFFFFSGAEMFSKLSRKQVILQSLSPAAEEQAATPLSDFILQWHFSTQALTETAIIKDIRLAFKVLEVNKLSRNKWQWSGRLPTIKVQAKGLEWSLKKRLPLTLEGHGGLTPVQSPWKAISLGQNLGSASRRLNGRKMSEKYWEI